MVVFLELLNVVGICLVGFSNLVSSDGLVCVLVFLYLGNIIVIICLGVEGIILGFFCFEEFFGKGVFNCFDGCILGCFFIESLM